MDTTQEAKGILKKLVEGNIRYAKANSAKYDALTDGQQPKATLLMCSDSRVPGGLFNFDTVNYIFTAENIGNQLATNQGGIDYGIMHLHTPVLMILGHGGCGAIKACLGDYSKETPEIKKELDTLKAVFAGIKIKDDPYYVKHAQLNVDYQVAQAVKRYKGLLNDRILAVVGAMFDFHKAYFQDARARIAIVNVNGITDVAVLKSSPLLKDIGIEGVVKRLG